MPNTKVGYRIEYYYDNEIDNEKTEVLQAEKGTIITKEEIKAKADLNIKEKYTYLSMINAPLTVGETDNNVIKVYYKKSELPNPNPEDPTPVPNTKVGYRIEYYYENEIDNSKSELYEVEINTEITKTEIETKAESNLKQGYKLLTIANAPLVVSDNIDNNVIKVYYILKEITVDPTPENPTPTPVPNNKVGYKIEYYYDNEIDNEKTEVNEVEKGTVISKEDIEAKANLNVKDGYKYLSMINAPLTVGETDNNVIKVYYILKEIPVDPTPENPNPTPVPNNKVGYRIEYYYNNEIDNTKSELKEAEIGAIISKSDIEEKAKNNIKDGYKLAIITNAPLIVSQTVEDNVIKVYYILEKDPENPDVPVEEKTGYRVEYYYDNQIDNNKTEFVEIKVGDIVTKEEIKTKADKNAKEGYEFLSIINAPLTAKENIENNVIKVYYKKSMISGGETDPTPVPNTKVGYRIEYYYNNEIDNEKSELYEVEKGTVIAKETIQEKAIKNSKDGYEFLNIVNAPLTVGENIDNNVIKVYYKLSMITVDPTPENPTPTPIPNTKVAYRIEYYYENAIDNEKTESYEVEVGTKISKEEIKAKAETNNKEGYEFLNIINAPLLISENVDNNVIKVYYKLSMITVDPTPENPTPTPVPNTKVGYRIEYYYDDVINNEKSELYEVEKETVISKAEIEAKAEKNLIDGFRVLIITNAPLTVGENIDNNVIRVYYETIPENPDPEVPILETRYRVEYYYDNEIDNEKTELLKADKETVISKAEIEAKADRNIKEGYRLFTILNVPLTVGDKIENNVIKVYYVTKNEENPDENDKFAYRIEYYYDNEIDNEKTELLEAEKGTVISKEDIEAKAASGIVDGYRLFTLVNAPLTVSEDVENNVIKIFYVTNNPEEPEKFAYRIEYYYNNEINNGKTELYEAEKGTVISKEDIEAKAASGILEGYRLFTLVNAPLTVSEDIDNNVIKIFYVTKTNPDDPDSNKFAYRIEYYYDNIINNGKTELLEAEKDTKITKAEIEAKAETNKVNGYKLFTIINAPLIVSEDIDNNVVKIYYVKANPENPDEPIDINKTAYRIEYYYDDKIDNSKTELIETEKGTEISREELNTKLEANSKEGYKLLALVNAPLKVTENIENNVIKIFYVSEMIPGEPDPEDPDAPVVPVPNTKVGYRIEYYYENKIDNEKTELVQVEKDTIITRLQIEEKAVENLKEGYKLLTIINAPYTATADIDNNVIKVYYVLKEITVEPTPEDPNPAPVPNTKVGYRIEYYYEDKIDNSKTELVETEIGNVIAKADIEAKAAVNNKEGYKLLTIVNAPLTASNEIDNNVIKVYYVKTTIPGPIDPDNPEKPVDPVENETVGYRIEYYYDNNINNAETEIVQVSKGTVVTRAEIEAKANNNLKDAYKLLTIVNVPLTAGENIDNNAIKVYYISKMINIGPDEEIENTKVGYRVEYYYDNKIDNSRTEIVEARIDEIVTKEAIDEKAKNNLVEGYKVLTSVNSPLKVQANVENNVIKIYYVKEKIELVPGGEVVENNIAAYRIE